MEIVLIALSVGFFGSMHCIGMCGGLVTALSMTRSGTWWSGLTAYQLGRVTTYTVLGLLSGLIGFSVKQIGYFDQAQILLSLLAGLIMIAFGLNLAGWTADPFARLGGRAIGGMGLANRIRSAAEKGLRLQWYGIGLANGLLPCGLVYAALAISVTAGGIRESGVAMMAFGLGTVPAMMVAPVLVQAIAGKKRGLIMKLLGVAVIIMGLFTMIRGSGLMHMLHGDSHSAATHQMQPSDSTMPMHHHEMSHTAP